MLDLRWKVDHFDAMLASWMEWHSANQMHAMFIILRMARSARVSRA
jgi:hypothetical protein